MEKITEYQFHNEAGKQVLREVYFSNNKVILLTNGESPTEAEVNKLESLPISEAGYQAAWYQAALKIKPYEKLLPMNKIILDFLNTRLTS